MRLHRIALAAVAGIGLLGVPAVAAEFDAVLLLDAFDGCDCQEDPNPAWEGDCPPCDVLLTWPDLCPPDPETGLPYCNIHDGISNCPETGKCDQDQQCNGPNHFPNMDFLGPNSVDDSWANAGVADDMAGSSFVSDISTVDPLNMFAQQSTLRRNAFPFGEVNAGDFFGLTYIDPTHDCPDSGWRTIHIEDLRQQYNAANPSTPLPTPDPNGPAYLTFDYRREGDETMPLHATIQFLASHVQPAGVNPTWTTDGSNEIPADGMWHSVPLVTFDGYPETILTFQLAIEINDGQAGTLESNLTVFWDNLRLVYTSTGEICNNEIDDNGNNLVDCEDPACVDDPVCNCKQPPFDVDVDGDVDGNDFGKFQTCFRADYETLVLDCRCLDVDGPGGEPDMVVDEMDANAFETCAETSGPGIPYDELACQ